MSISVSKQSLLIAKRNLSDFEEISVISFRIEMFRRLRAVSTLSYTSNVRLTSFSFEISPANCKTQSFVYLVEISVISFRTEILRHLNVLSTAFYTPHVVHVDFSVENIPENRKTQAFKLRRKLWYFVPNWDTTAFKRSFHSILHAQWSARRFQCRNNPCKSLNAIFHISTKTLLFRSWLRYYGI
jgi:hypothetical protein